MKETRIMMGMPISIEVVPTGQAPEAVRTAIDDAFAFFGYVDDTFSPHKPESEISRINDGRLSAANASGPVQTILSLAEETRQDTQGFFNIYRDGRCDPSGLVKGWAVFTAAAVVASRGLQHFYVDAGGDIQAMGFNAEHGLWRVGIRNPFNMREIIKALGVTNAGVATSGTYARGQHIYDPTATTPLQTSVVSLTVVGPNVYEADRFATAAFAMGEAGVRFIESLDGFEAYQINESGVATFTSGFDRWVME